MDNVVDMSDIDLLTELEALAGTARFVEACIHDDDPVITDEHKMAVAARQEAVRKELARRLTGGRYAPK